MVFRALVGMIFLLTDLSLLRFLSLMLTQFLLVPV
jgi:hypothetical protein